MSRSAAQLRTAEIATIKIASKQLGLDDDTYRTLLLNITGKRSAADLDWQQRKAVIDRLKQLGAKIGKGTKGKPANLDREPYLQKIEALLADMELPWAYAEAIAERITGGKNGGIQKLAWVREPKHFAGIVAALMYEKGKRLGPALDALGVELQARGLGPTWCQEQVKQMEGLPRWPWSECLEAIRRLTALLEADTEGNP